MEAGEIKSATSPKLHTHVKDNPKTGRKGCRLIKANSVAVSPFDKFQQLERQNSLPSSVSLKNSTFKSTKASSKSTNDNIKEEATSKTVLFKFTDPGLAKSASTVKERLLNWVKAQTTDYNNIQIENFSTSWNNGLAFCALIHHFCPHAFDYSKLIPEKRRYNFELAFKVAEDEAGIYPLLDVEDMVMMKRPDWKCVFTYVQAIYQRFHAKTEAIQP